MPISRAARLALLTCLAAVVAFIGPAVAPTSATPTTTATTNTSWTNNTFPASPFFQPDVDGEQIDAHSPHIITTHSESAGVQLTKYYMYGDSYKCGWKWLNAGTKWCGINVYSSTDLRHWKKEAKPLTDAQIDAPQAELGGQSLRTACAAGCFRPKVMYNPSTHLYVLWFNVSDRTKTHSGFVSATSTSPTGPFSAIENPQLIGYINNTDSNGDLNVFVDDDNTAWVAYTRIEQAGNDHYQVIEKLDENYTDKETDTGEEFHTSLAHLTDQSVYGGFGTEAPVLFREGDVYYLLYGPTCPYCHGSKTYFRKALDQGDAAVAFSHFGPATQISADSCMGQVDSVLRVGTSAGTRFLYLSDQWLGGTLGDNAVVGSANQAHSTPYMGPLNFTPGTTNLAPVTCQGQVTLSGIEGSPGQNTPLEAGWSGTNLEQGFVADCNIKSGGATAWQTFTAGQTGLLRSVWISAWERDSPNADLHIGITQVNASGLPGGLLAYGNFNLETLGTPDPGPGLVQQHWKAFSWAPSWVKFDLGNPISVTAGQQLGLKISSTATAGCYGVAAYGQGGSSTDPYPGGSMRYQYGGTWQPAWYDANFRFHVS